jgi:uncharacterized glyoxalase superfamily protein PhnB
VSDTSQLHARLSDRDAPAAVAWLDAVGFALVRRQPADGNLTHHAQVRLGDMVLMIASADADYDMPALKGRYGLYLRPEDVDAIYEPALAAGGTSVCPPESTEWGTRRARVLDPEGCDTESW